MNTITITITVEGGNVTVSTVGAGATSRPAQGGARGKGRRSNEVIPPGGSSQPMPGKKGQEGLTIGEADMNDLTWWADKIAAGLRSDPDSRYADKNLEDLDALRAEIARREGGTQRAPAQKLRGERDDNNDFENDGFPPDDTDIPF